MWGMAAISEEDRLDRVQTLRTLRRSYDLARPQRRILHSALTLVLVSTLVTLAGPLLLRYAIDHGIEDGNGRVLNWLIVVYLGITAFGYVVGRLQYLAINRAGEGFLSPCASPCSNDCNGNRWRSSIARRPACWSRA